MNPLHTAPTNDTGVPPVPPEAHQKAAGKPGHGLKVGDIVRKTWGYEQTNVTFFEVLHVPSERSATVREIEAECIEDGPGAMTGRTTPKPGHYVKDAKATNKRATGLHRLGDLSKWDGQPCRVTWYA